MRVKAEAILDFGWADDLADNQTVRDYRQEYKALSEILDRRGEILDLVHRDLEQLSKATSHRGRKPAFTSENLFSGGPRHATPSTGLPPSVDPHRRKRNVAEVLPPAEETDNGFHPAQQGFCRDQARDLGAHKPLVSKDKFITDYVVLEKNRSDDTLLPLVIERHEERYGRRPESVAADKGFCPDEETYEELEEQIDYLGVPRRTRDFGEQLMGIWQQWRAGIEGTISCLKRAFRLARCCFRGFKKFASAIGSAVFCHNLRILAKMPGG